MRKPRVLAAVPPPALPFLADALGPAVELVACHALDEAKQRVRDNRLDLVLCGVYFDQSALFDLLQFVDRRLPVLCCRILAFEMPSISLEALRIACESLGARFVDLPTLAAERGDEAGRAELRSLVLAAAQGRSHHTAKQF